MAKELGASPPKEMAYYVQIVVSEPTSKTELARIVAESEDDSLAPQSPFVIPTEERTLLIPQAANGTATVEATLNIGASEGHRVSGTLQLAEGRKKQWLQ